MSEKKPQSTVQREQSHGFNSPAEDELDLRELLKFLARKKVFILAITSVCAIFSILYAQMITPSYRVTVGLLDHDERFSSSSNLEQLDLKLLDKNNQNIQPISVFERFLFNIKSHEFKKEVFVNGGFQEKFSREMGIDTDQSVSAIYDSTKIGAHRGSAYLELETSKPKVTLEFLKALIEAAKENVNAEINDIHRSTVKTGINNLSAQIGKLHQQTAVHKQIEKEKTAMEIEELRQIKAIEIEELRQKKAIEIEKLRQKKAIEIEKLHQQITEREQIENIEIEKLRQKKAIEIEKLHQQITEQKQIEKERKEIEIVRLSKALEMAKRMGIKNNNFGKPGDVNFPAWFRYGELALQQRIRSLRSKKEEIPNTKNLLAKLKLERLQQEINSLGSKKEAIPNTKYLLAKLKLKRLQQEIRSLGPKKEEISNTKNLLAKLKLKRLQQEIRSLGPEKEEISNTKNLLAKLKLKKSQTYDLPLIKFKVVTIGKHGYSRTESNRPWVIVGFGLAFGLFISIFMAYLIDLKKS